MLSENREVDALVVIPFHNRADLATVALGTLVGSGFPLSQILVIDNGSSPEQTRALRKAFPGLEISEQENLGFGAAANHGIRCAIERQHAFTFILNTDAIVTTDIIDRMANYLQREGNTRTAACAPITVSRGTTDFAGGLIDPRKWSAWHVHHVEEGSRRVREEGLKFYLTGCALMCRNSALQEVGMFDEKFFMYWEDCDLCLRLAAAGWQLAVLPALTVEHLVGGTSGESLDAFRIYYENRNRFLMWWRHGGGIATLRRIVKELLPSLAASSPRCVTPQQLTLGRAVLDGLLNAGGKRQFMERGSSHQIGSYALWFCCALIASSQEGVGRIKSCFRRTKRRAPMSSCGKLR
jgi:GT2 family glycosyltransferase